MIKSMTGYGGAKGSVEGLSVSVELRSVNNRYLDVTVKLPRTLLFAEETIKQAVGRHISRGKVDVFVTVDASNSDDMEVRVNEPLLRGYLETLGGVAVKYGLQNDLTLMSVCRLPEVLSTDRREMDNSAVLEGIKDILEQALTEYDAMRLREGEKLRDDVLSRLDEISRLTGIVEENAPKTVAEYRARLEQKLQEVLGSANIDESRILTEAAIFADRIAVDEETVRLRSHLSQLRGLTLGESPAGRKMDFLIQELNRESNTIGSKCQNADIAHVVVDLKAEIEKIREQIQNVE
ncbi:MAG TPA: YicC family protein [Candidatus Scatomorpha pullistercoris]|uniref:YicC family protein n=1 Tax=Candidatus Scatomorpha pullistercoris TaxID=2840929 RepID=A0A9D1G5B8_9FIRM|nr:YicC family protein [Candidatus Scatomorpha pullistercoris]